MSYGLKVLNDNLKLQIDATYTNYALHEHGEDISTIYQTYDSRPKWYYKVVSFSASTLQPPLIAIKPSSAGYCGLYSYTKSGNNYTGFIIFSQEAVVTFSWQSFIPSTTKSSESYGLRVYDASSVLVFDSGYAQMIISDVDTANPVYSVVQTITYPSDSNAYHIVSPFGEIRYIEGDQTYTYHYFYIAMLKSLSSTQVSFGGYLYLSLVIPDPNIPTGTWGYWPSLWTIITVKKAF